MTRDSNHLSTEVGLYWASVLRRAALAGRDGIIDNYSFESRMKVIERGAGGDLTLKIDRASESRIYKSLVKDLGKDSFVFLSEEIGEVKTDSHDPRPIVVCDPLDGSHNAQVGIPLYAISLCVLGLNRRISEGDRRLLEDVDVGFIMNIPAGDEYYAIRGKGAFHDNKKIVNRRPIRPPDPADRFPTIGIECGDLNLLKSALEYLNSDNVYKLRVLGSAAISFCLLADGTLDGLLFIQPNGARTIDSPAGYLIASEAGRFFSLLGEEKTKRLGLVSLGFESRVNLIGGRNRAVLSRLSSLVHLRR